MTSVCKFSFPSFLGLCGLIGLSCPASADDAAPAGMISEYTGQDAAAWAGLQGSGWIIGGWGTAGINYNTDDPHDSSNGPMNMTDRNGELNLYQLDLFAEKAIVKTGSWDLGGRIDYMFGTDSRYTQAAGTWDTKIMNPNSYYNMAVPQAYVEVFAPVGNGLSGKIGHFYTIIGYESVPSALNFFSSHTYSFKSSPFTTTGALFNYTINDQWNVNLGAVKGMDNFDLNPGAWGQMSGINWANAETGTSLSFSIMQGNAYQNMPANDLEYYSVIFQQQLGKWHYVLQHDRGTINHAINNNQDTAVWYSVAQYLTYQLDDVWGLGLRGEWFRDQSGFRYNNGEANYYDVTAGVNYKPKSWLLVRPELRYDWAQAQTAPFDSGHQSNQVVLGIDAVVQF
jgi:hypothetical protein